MNFDLSEEQQLLSDSVARFVSDQYPLDQRQLTVLSEPVSYTHLTLPTKQPV